ncbi:MurR/RpiR family transcriptional regulator [Shimia biformata]|uniref:MurR/RpiR family transcriptional regulator n=1 Tax=Shimia biformata TaxID=1294299 RepID=UPI001EF2CDEC|nr:MurR/RpiR family transcriptional regulator [Shimia biformata]
MRHEGTRDLTGSFEQRLASNYSGLSAKLREAGDYVAAHPVNTATRSLRAVSLESGLAPATFSRLARALDYDSFEDLRESMRQKLDRRVNAFADRATQLQERHKGAGTTFFGDHSAACIQNIGRLTTEIDPAALDAAVDHLHKARRVLLYGALGSTGIVEYLAYMAHFCADNWQLAGRMGASLGAALTGLDQRDVLLIVTKPPFSTKVLSAARAAADAGVHVIVITDTHACPALKYASSGFIVPTDSPHFYSSYVATMVLVETIVGMLVSRAGETARDRIAQVERNNRILEEVRDG